MRGKKAKRITILAVILCIPLVFIVYFGFKYASQSILLDAVTGVKVTLPDGNSYLFDSDSDIEEYRSLLLDSHEIREPVRDVFSEKPITVVYIDSAGEQEYQLYPSQSISGCMICSSKGKFYLLSEDCARAYLCRAECLYMYKSINVPTLNVTSGSHTFGVAPKSYDWQYKKVDGNFYPDKASPLYASELIYAYDGEDTSWAFADGMEPSETEVSFLTEDGERLAISDIASLECDTDTYITVTYKAKWSRAAGNDFFGEATYSFRLLYDVPASIKLSKRSVTAGEVVVIALINMNEDDEINITTELKTNAIICYKDDGTGRNFALMAVDVKNPEGVYDIDFELAGTVISDKIVVNGYDGTFTPLYETESEYNEMLTDAKISELKSSFDALTGGRSVDSYFDFGDAFIKPVSGTAVASFGDSLWVKTSGITYRLPGNVYGVEEGTSVKAAQYGLVVFARGTATTGNTVVISHGYGVFTYYFNLSTITCEVGSTVTQEQIIGNSGTTGFTAGKGGITQFAVSVGGTFVNPSVFLSEMTIPK